MTAIKANHLTRFFGTLQPGPGDKRLCLISDFAAHGSLLHFFENAEVDELDISLSHKLVMARQAGDGLLSLHQHDLVHADVAARNVLVYKFDADNHHHTLVKLSDYGLVRTKSNYTDVAAAGGDQGAAGEPLPLAPKWSAWESLKKDKFYPASDIWSFGVLVWEILTEGDTPYPDVLNTIMAMTDHLESGCRLRRPKKICDDALWALMVQCWREKRKERPALEAILAQLSHSMEQAAAVAATATISTKLQALEALQKSWLMPGFGWRAGDIVLTPALDAELQYSSSSSGAVAVADPRDSEDGSKAELLADAIEDLALSKGGRRGGPFKASVLATTLAKNRALIAAFNGRMQRLYTQRQENQGTKLFNGRWDAGLHGPALQEKRDVYARLAHCFVDTDLGPGASVKVALMWHGVPSEAVADAILTMGISSRVSGKDEGYFGKGVYLTPQAEYAAFYANGQRPPKRGQTYTLLLCAVCLGNTYPVTRRVDYDTGASISVFHYNHGKNGTAKALKGGFDAHAVAVSTTEEWQAASAVDAADYDELVVGSEEQILPFAKVTVRMK
jgi:hypothetical protein